MDMVNKESNSRPEIAETLGVGQHSQRHRRLRWVGGTVVVLLLLAGIYMIFVPADAPAYRYETAEVKKGDLTVTVTATGTVQPVNQVDVGSEVSGTIKEVAVDFNDRVERGQVLARLDTDRLKAQVIEARESLQSAKAKLEEAKATVLETRLRFQRCEKLFARQLCSGEDLDTARASQARARAAQASAKAQVAVAQAALGARETDLAKAVIRSPIDGVVLKRQIEPGQTVAASLQAPLLFTLAEDLKNMELHVAVDEADVGKIEEGQSAVFTVDAYPDRTFPAKISQVRFAPQTIEGVVTYETVLSVDNSDLSLRPGMTATAVVTVQQLNDVVLIPNAALRFMPPVTQTTKSRSGGGLFGAIFRRPHRDRRQPETTTGKSQKVWILQDGQLISLAVKTGPSDGRLTQVVEGEIAPDQEVVTDAVSIKK
ncbi:MAG: efflux RND transporter periplasmic adaptor subunit [Gammaproteobacteria bacterium]|jgi:HlyD family secretion protein